MHYTTLWTMNNAQTDITAIPYYALYYTILYSIIHYPTHLCTANVSSQSPKRSETTATSI